MSDDVNLTDSEGVPGEDGPTQTLKDQFKQAVQAYEEACSTLQTIGDEITAEFMERFIALMEEYNITLSLVPSAPGMYSIGVRTEVDGKTAGNLTIKNVTSQFTAFHLMVS